MSFLPEAAGLAKHRARRKRGQLCMMIDNDERQHMTILELIEQVMTCKATQVEIRKTQRTHINSYQITIDHPHIVVLMRQGFSEE